MTLRRAIPLVVLGGALAALAVPLIIGDGEARLAAGFGIASIVGMTAVVVHRERIEHADDAQMPGLLVLAIDGLHGAGWLVVGLSVYVVIVIAAVTAPGSGRREEAGWPGVAMAVGAGGAVVGGFVGMLRSTRRVEGVERRMLVESTSIAFFVTVLAALVYALFEAFADAPRVSMWAVWAIGCGAWMVAGAVLHKRAA